MLCGVGRVANPQTPIVDNARPWWRLPLDGKQQKLPPEILKERYLLYCARKHKLNQERSADARKRKRQRTEEEKNDMADDESRRTHSVKDDAIKEEPEHNEQSTPSSSKACIGISSKDEQRKQLLFALKGMTLEERMMLFAEANVQSDEKMNIKVEEQKA